MKSLKIIIAVAVLFSACKSKYPALEEGLYADIQTNKGDVLVKLHHQDVPMTVANFVSLAEGNHPKATDSLKGKPFFNNTKFHRVIKNFMIQGGDPTGTGRGSAGYQFADEFPTDENGNLLYKHDSAGVLSMANSGPKTNSSQFFITHKATNWLDRKHSVFGKVHLGQSVVDSIQKNDYIKEIAIIRIGSSAKKFDAPMIFSSEIAREAEAQKKLVGSFKTDKKRATETTSGLKYLTLTKGNGKQVNPAIPTTVHYTLYLANGKKIDSSLDKGKTFTFTIDKMGLIAGWKEGMKLMREGDKTRLFIPSFLGYGDKNMGSIPANSDLIFDIEVLKVGK